MRSRLFRCLGRRELAGGGRRPLAVFFFTDPRVFAGELIAEHHCHTRPKQPYTQIEVPRAYCTRSNGVSDKSVRSRRERAWDVENQAFKAAIFQFQQSSIEVYRSSSRDRPLALGRG